MKKIQLLTMAASLLCCLILNACVDVTDNPVIPTNINEASVFSSEIDASTYAGDDFYQYALGTWLAQNPVPTESGDSAVGTNNTQIDNVTEALADIIDDDQNAILNALFNAYSQETLKADSTTLMKKLEEVDAVKTQDEMTKLMAKLARYGYACPFVVVPAPYLRKIYPELILIDEFSLTEKKILKMGISSAEAKAILDMGNKWKAVVKDEKQYKTKHGFGHSDPNKNRQLFTNFNRRAAGKGLIDALAAELDINLETVAADSDYDIYFNKLASYSLAEQKLLVKYGILVRDVYYLPFDPMRPLNVEDMKQLLTKIIILCQDEHSGLFTSVSHSYVERIDKNAKKEVTDMFEKIRAAFRNRIENNNWMSDATKKKAIEKLEKMSFLCGWPENWHPEWEATMPQGNSFYEKVCDLFSQYADLTKKLIGQTSDDAMFYGNWMTEPAYTSNAFFSYQNNMVLLLASNLVPPIYDKKKPDFYNYAILGASTISHEITHGFDSDGSKYDAAGRKSDWWAPQDTVIFKAKQQQMIKHFSKFEYMPGVFCDGEKTLAENIADLGGLEIGYEAYMNTVTTTQSAERDRLGREFFRAFAEAWKTNETLKKMEIYKKDTHSAPKLRVNGNVCLTNEWYRVFGISSGRLYLAPDERILIW